jgi:hypothetical protein
VVDNSAVFIITAADLIVGKRLYVVSLVKDSRLADIPTVVIPERSGFSTSTSGSCTSGVGLDVLPELVEEFELSVELLVTLDDVPEEVVGLEDVVGLEEVVGLEAGILIAQVEE